MDRAPDDDRAERPHLTGAGRRGTPHTIHKQEIHAYR